MSNVQKSWSAITEKKGGGSGGQSDIVFLNAKNLPQQLLPSTSVLEYEAIYDAETKTNRLAKEGEKGIRTFLFYGMNDKKEVRVYQCKMQVASKIKNLLKSLEALKILSFVKVTATGSGMNTEYDVEAVNLTPAPIPAGIWSNPKYKEKLDEMPKLEEIRDRLTRNTETSEAPEKTEKTETVETANTGDDLIL
jgi:hypothetical protein